MGTWRVPIYQFRVLATFRIDDLRLSSRHVLGTVSFRKKVGAYHAIVPGPGRAISYARRNKVRTLRVAKAYPSIPHPAMTASARADT